MIIITINPHSKFESTSYGFNFVACCGSKKIRYTISHTPIVFKIFTKNLVSFMNGWAYSQSDHWKFYRNNNADENISGSIWNFPWTNGVFGYGYYSVQIAPVWACSFNFWTNEGPAPYTSNEEQQYRRQWHRTHGSPAPYAPQHLVDCHTILFPLHYSGHLYVTLYSPPLHQILKLVPSTFWLLTLP